MLPECQVVDPKSIVSDNSSSGANELSKQQQQQQQLQSYDLNDMNFISKNGAKRGLAEAGHSSNECHVPSKKVCSSSSNSNSPQQQQQQQQSQYAKYSYQSSDTSRSVSLLNDSPLSSCSTSSTSTSSSSTGSVAFLPTPQSMLSANQEPIQLISSANIIDASNFDFLDYLPELNSNTIDQTITTVTNAGGEAASASLDTFYGYSSFQANQQQYYANQNAYDY